MQKFLLTLISLALLLSACSAQPPAPAQAGALKILVVESYLADITANIAGQRASVETLIPIGLDPHAFEPTPQDVARIANTDVLVVNGAGFEEWLSQTIENSRGRSLLIEASTGLAARSPTPNEAVLLEEHVDEQAGEEPHGDPHFWLDPLKVVAYVENIRAGLVQVDPEGAAIYNENAEAYIAQLKDLDTWIQTQVEQIPPQRRLLVTNHESFGYFSDRYGFEIIGAIIPSTSTGASPSARQMAALIDHIRSTGAPAIFLETGANPQLARQISAETGVSLVTDLYTHSITAPDGPAPDYITMMKHNTLAIVNALKSSGE